MKCRRVIGGFIALSTVLGAGRSRIAVPEPAKRAAIDPMSRSLGRVRRFRERKSSE